MGRCEQAQQSKRPWLIGLISSIGIFGQLESSVIVGAKPLLNKERIVFVRAIVIIGR